MGNSVSFGPFVLDVAQRKLLYGGAHVALKPKEAELLVLLTERRPQIVSKDEIIEHLWNGAAASDAALTQTMYRLRRTLADHAGNDRDIIRTVHGIGFQFVGESPIALQREELDALRPVLSRYQQAVFQYRQHTEAALLASIPLFESVHAEDPQYLPALIKLAKAYTSAGIRLLLPPHDAYSRALQALHAVIARDPASSDAFATLSTLLLFFDGPHARASEAAEQALLLAPESPAAHRAAAWERLASGHVASALTHADAVVQSAASSHRATALLGTILYLARRYDDAHACFEAVRAVAPLDPLALIFDACAYAVTGCFERADALLDLTTGDDLRPRALAVRGYIAARRGDRRGCAGAIAQLEAMAIPTNVSRAAVYRAQGNYALAAHSLREARLLHEPALFIAAIDPVYDLQSSDVTIRFAR